MRSSKNRVQKREALLESGSSQSGEGGGEAGPPDPEADLRLLPPASVLVVDPRPVLPASRLARERQPRGSCALAMIKFAGIGGRDYNDVT